MSKYFYGRIADGEMQRRSSIFTPYVGKICKVYPSSHGLVNAFLPDDVRPITVPWEWVVPVEEERGEINVNNLTEEIEEMERLVNARN